MNNNRFISGTIIILCLSLFIPAAISAQQDKKSTQNKKPVQTTNKKSSQSTEQSGPAWNKEVRISPKASVTEVIGITDVSISYSSPGVKGRKIWGGLVPYDKVWRAGANEATKITFGGDVWIEGKKLPAGSYGFFIIPREKEWTIIFNKVADQWGAFEYNEAQDALRLNVTPQQSDFLEWLSYNFSDMKVNTHGKNSAIINLYWEKTRLSFTVETDVK